jgi:recombination protein RecR
MSESSLLKGLIDALRVLPGVGARTAQRMAFHLLQHDRARGLHLAQTMAQALEYIHHCRLCRTLTENELCKICSDSGRDGKVICVV